MGTLTEWQNAKLSELATSVSSGKTTQRKTYARFPLYGSTGPIGMTDRAEFDGPSILVARVGANAGAVYQVDGRYGVSDNTLVVRLAPSHDVNFYTEVLRGLNLNTMVYGSGQPLVTGSMIKALYVPAISAEEQRRISAALHDADAFISSLERLIAKKREIKQAMMQKLLTGKTRLSGFAEPWMKQRLGSVGIFLKGRGIRRDDVSASGVPCIRYGELYTAFNDYTSTTKSFVSDDIAAAALPLKSGDLLFAGSGETRDEIGKCVAYTGSTPAVAGGDIVVLRGDGFNPVYLGLLANTSAVVDQKSRAGQGDAVVHISSRALAGIEVKLPPRNEQDSIAEVIVDTDREIKLICDRLAKAKSIKQGMMQELLAGRTRLPVEVSS